VELEEESREWVKDMKAFTLWEKPGLMVKLSPVRE